MLAEPARQKLLDAREAVWRAFFAHDQAALDKLIPEELVTIEANGSEFGNRNAVMAGSEAFAKSGARLVKLEFPKTEVQCYGNTAVVYSTYLYELEKDGRRNPYSGRVTEVFVQRKGQWVNPGWHMDSGTGSEARRTSQKFEILNPSVVCLMILLSRREHGGRPMETFTKLFGN
jgi:ketosteroid isomerase-like protein